MANELYYLSSDSGRLTSGGSYSRNLAIIGHVSSSGVFVSGALRFANVGIGQGVTVDSASVYFKSDEQGSGSGNLRFKTYGIDEDNTADFSSNPFGRSLTSAFDSADNPLPGAGNFKQITVTSIVNEILGRGGWSSGNAMGFIMEDHTSQDSDTDCYIRDPQFGESDLESFLVIRVNALPDFTPTPTTVAAPTLPAGGNFGMKYSPSGVNVFTATDQELLLTTRKYQYKIYAQDQTSCTGGVLKAIAHGLNYTPQVMCFARKNGYSFQLPRLFGGASDPVGGGVQSWVGVDDEYLYIYPSVDTDVYYYIFLDEQPN